MKNKITHIVQTKSEVIIIISAILLGGWIRLNYVLSADFPLNDGGLFYTMARDLIANNFKVPLFTTYNQANIPFAYPFLPVYCIAFLNQFFGVDLLDSLRFLPLIFNISVIPFVYFLLKKLTDSEEIALLALLIYVIISPSYAWFIMGGGITRASGWLFAVIAINVYLDSISHFKKVNYILLPILIALTFACHLEIGYFLVFTLLLFYLFFSKSFKGAFFISITGIISIILLMPYWITVVRYHGISIFFNVFSASEFNIEYSILKFFFFNFTFERFMPIVAVISFLGFVFCLFSNKKYFSVWLLVILFLDPRSVDRSSSIVISALAAIGYFKIVFPGIQKAIKTNPRINSNKYEIFIHSVFYFFIIFGFLFSSFVTSSSDAAISEDHRDAMGKISHTIPNPSRFLVLSEIDDWGKDQVGEWFPALSERESILTVQGTEWLGGGVFSNKVRNYNDLGDCIKRNATCFEEWFKDNKKDFDYVYFSKELINTQKIRVENILNSPTAIIDNEDVLVYKVDH